MPLGNHNTHSHSTTHTITAYAADGDAAAAAVAVSSNSPVNTVLSMDSLTCEAMTTPIRAHTRGYW